MILRRDTIVTVEARPHSKPPQPENQRKLNSCKAGHLFNIKPRDADEAFGLWYLYWALRDRNDYVADLTDNEFNKAVTPVANET